MVVVAGILLSLSGLWRRSQLEPWRQHWLALLLCRCRCPACGVGRSWGESDVVVVDVDVVC